LRAERVALFVCLYKELSVCVCVYTVSRAECVEG
jgi:hypothetical protein